jgi:carbamoyltransferase
MGTARLQVVDKTTSPLYHELIRRFDEATGVPMVLNTSFNVRGEPIVNTPQNALSTFINSGIDTLVMGDYIIEKALMS